MEEIEEEEIQAAYKWFCEDLQKKGIEPAPYYSFKASYLAAHKYSKGG